MKTHFTSIILLAITSLIFSSCGSLTITKRVHNKGYHVSFNKHYTSASQNDEASEADAQPIRDEQATISKNGSQVVSNHSHLQHTKIESQNLALVNEEKTSSEFTPTSKKIDAKILPPFVTASKILMDNDVNRPTVKKMGMDREGGMSMLWIVIVIVLVLWLLGYLGGLGSFIHLLLVIALILLILWLLQII